MPKAYLSLGSNQEPEQHLAAAVQALKQAFGEVVLSDWVQTKAVGFDGPDFINGAAIIETDWDVYTLDAWLHELEDAQGRKRDVPRFSSRTLDIDIIFFDDLILSGPGNLQIPRPELKHAFVLGPLAQIAPDYVNPESGATLREAWVQLQSQL
jgi:2-amino-4-hydroxy-6-hydroxymethyldihydropteridine diphosphokinase